MQYYETTIFRRSYGCSYRSGLQSQHECVYVCCQKKIQKKSKILNYQLLVLEK